MRWFALPLSLLAQLAFADVEFLGLYRCSQELARADIGKKSPGPVFAENDLVFTSIENPSHTESTLLVVTELEGYPFSLPKEFYPRVQVEVPDPNPRLLPKTVYMRYMHSEILGSRYSDYTQDYPAFGFSRSQYARLSRLPMTREDLKNKFYLSVALHIQKITQQIRRSEIGSSQVLSANLSFCRNILKEPVIDALVSRGIDEFEFFSSGRVQPTHRAPASLVPTISSPRRP